MTEKLIPMGAAALFLLFFFIAAPFSPAKAVPPAAAAAEEAVSDSSLSGQSAAPASLLPAHLRFNGTDIDDTVVQGEDNAYYLRRSAEGEYDVWGCYFFDYECTAQSTNLIIYGHSLADNPDSARFSQLKRLNNPDFAAEHSTVTLTLDGVENTYRVFAAGVVDTQHTELLNANPDQQQMTEIITYAQSCSTLQFNAEVPAAAQILTLITCTEADNTRYAVWAVKI